MQCPSRHGFEAFCEATAAASDVSGPEGSRLCFLALGQSILAPGSLDDRAGSDLEDDEEDDEDSAMDSVPILFVPILLHSQTVLSAGQKRPETAGTAGVCTMEPAGTAYLNPLLVAANPDFQHGCSGAGADALAWALSRGQPWARLFAARPGTPEGFGCVAQRSDSGHQLLLPPANWCPMFVPRAAQGGRLSCRR